MQDEDDLARLTIIENGECLKNLRFLCWVPGENNAEPADAVAQIRGRLIDVLVLDLRDVFRLKHYKETPVRLPDILPERTVCLVRVDDVTPFSAVDGALLQFAVREFRLEQVVEDAKHLFLVECGVFATGLNRAQSAEEFIGRR